MADPRIATPSVVVGGATGRIGAATLRALAERGVDAAALARGPNRPVAAERVVIADFDDPTGLREALAGAERFLLCSAHGPRMRAQQLAAVEAAAAAGVERIVKISASPASIFPGTPSGAAAAHLAVEDMLRASGIASVSIRPNAFMQTLLGFASQFGSGTLALPLADAAISWVDADDVGRVAAELLISDRDDGIVDVTGPDALTMDQVCGTIAARVGHPVAYLPVSEEQARAGLAARGLDAWHVDHLLGIFRLFRERDAGRVSDAVARLAGRPATSLAAFVERAFEPAPDA